MNEFFKELDKMHDSMGYDNKIVEFLQWYFSDEYTENLTADNAGMMYHLAAYIKSIHEVI